MDAKKMSAVLRTGIRCQTRLMLGIAGTCLAGLIFTITIGVIGRLFGNPVGASYEVSTVLMGTLILLGLATTTSRNIHTKVDLLFSRFPPKFQAGVGCFITVTMMVIWALMAWQNIKAGLSYMERGQETEYLKIPLYPFYFLVAVGAFACLLESSLHLGNWIVRLKGGE